MVHKLCLGRHLKMLMFGDRTLVLNIFIGLIVSRRVAGSFRPDNLHVGINLLH